jgi:hypothetical protein
MAAKGRKKRELRVVPPPENRILSGLPEGSDLVFNTFFNPVLKI